MDVHCSSCGEPWDVYHLRHDAIYETGLTEEEIQAWRWFSCEDRLSAEYREKFKTAGYEFGASILNVKRCPACPNDATPNPDKAAFKAGITEMLGDDEDGIAATFEDFGL